MREREPGTSAGASTGAGRSTHQRVGLFLGPLIAAGLLALPAPADLSAAGWRTAALGLLMGVWWATEAVPVPATALLPIAVFPILGIADVAAVTAPFANPIIYLFLGGFLVALGIQRWGLHRRIALAVIALFGRSGASLVGGFMVASALVSMWVTNTSTTMMLLPIATSVVTVVQQSLGESADEERFPIAMLLGVAYGATIGGMATLVGTPPNALLAAFLLEDHGIEIGFAQWMLVGVPVTTCMLPVTWWLLTRRLYPVRFVTSPATRQHLAGLRRQLGPMSRPERRIAAVFVALAAAWMARPLLSGIGGLEGLSDAGLAMLAAVALFLVPSGDEDHPQLMRWRDTAELPWGVLLLFGGGLALASVVSSTGLAAWLGRRLLGLGITDLTLLVVAIAALVIFLTELTSNLATTATFLPVVAAVAAEAGFAPVTLTVPVALAASCAFMLPVATPPNAVVYASGLLTIPQMVRAGFWLNLIGILLVSLAATVLAPLVLR